MCYPHPEASWSDRLVLERVWLHLVRREGGEEKQKWKETAVICQWKKTQKSLQMIVVHLFQAVATTQLDLCLCYTNDLFIHWHSLCQLHTSQSPTLLHESSPKSILTHWPSCSPIGQSDEEFKSLNHRLDYSGKSQINTSHSYVCHKPKCSFSNILPVCCIRQ